MVFAEKGLDRPVQRTNEREGKGRIGKDIDRTVPTFRIGNFLYFPFSFCGALALVWQDPVGRQARRYCTVSEVLGGVRWSVTA